MTEEPTFNLDVLKFDVGDLVRKSSGTSESFDVYVEVPFVDPEHNIIPVSPLTGLITLMKSDDAIECVLKDMNLTVEAPCDKCLKQFEYKVHVGRTERSFYILAENKQHLDDLCIDKKKLELDANELVRQEIILHFPIVLVCFPGCKGTCEQCGANRNEKKCKCEPVKDEDEEPKKPLSELQDLWKKIK